MKKCSKCKDEKPLTDFYKSKREKDGYQYSCKNCCKENNEKYDNSKNIKIQHLKFRDKNRDKLNRKSKQYYKENLNKCKDSVREYKKNNEDKIRKYNREYQNNRCQEDILFKLSKNLRSRTYSFLRGMKSKSTEELLGDSFLVVKNHLESTFTEGMTWENYGEWHVDHKIPLASAKTKEKVEKLFHYTNLQALWATDNWAKGSKIES